MTDNELLFALSNILEEKLNNELQPMKNDINELNNQILNIEIAVNHIKFMLENEIRINIQRGAKGHLDLSRNMQEAMKRTNEIEMLAIKVNMLETDMRYLKQKIHN